MQRKTKTLVLFLSALAIGFPAILGAQGKSGEELPSPQLAPLDLLVGIWSVKQEHLDPAGSIIATAEGTEEITWVLNKHAIQRIYRTKTGASAFEAIGLLTWSEGARRFEGVWFDDVSTAGPTQTQGQWNDKDRSFVFELDAPDGRGGRVKYQTVDRFESDSSRVATTYQMKGSEVVKISEVKYTRTTPCPSAIRAIWDK